MIDASYETVRRWALKFGRSMPPESASADHARLTAALGRGLHPDRRQHPLSLARRRRRGRSSQRDRAAAAGPEAALKLMRRLLKRHGYLPDVIVTDRLRSYGAALRDLGLAYRHVTGGRSNNRAEVSHQPTRQRERQRRRFRSPGSAQRFLATHAAVYNHFNFQRHLISRRTLRELRSRAFAGWLEVAAA